ncbi:RsiV family protein [Patiriisocius hiemis]|uniref:RsiV family protein n=1 Tax=Patiriisocius hiemis TaxID=3075604 RepID=A0ABU2YG06_9FLAO|nr:RsiV family protein [Constantimarinum sp. W242]MDT0556165.1 RsiV family protein [Constantimarinum sp. W242]
MKTRTQIVLVIISILLLSCKEDLKQLRKDQRNVETIPQTENFEDVLPFDSIPQATNIEINKTKQVIFKRQSLINKEDDAKQLQELIIQKTFKRDEDLYLINFNYPYLNTSLKESYQNFNEYLEETYMDIAGVEASILEDKEMICDTLRINRFKEKRLVDYKIYNLNKNLISVLFYKENYYSGTLHPTYSFDCLNFDLDRSVFMNYEDFFNESTEEEMTQILNEVLREKINSGDIYYDCWEITFDDFFEYKDNFVVDDYKVEYYFDDCVICPSYTGTFSVEIPLERLLPVLRKYKLNPLLL